eukprot:6836016-Pyramimonas_sp.AAC.1
MRKRRREEEEGKEEEEEGGGGGGGERRRRRQEEEEEDEKVGASLEIPATINRSQDFVCWCQRCPATPPCSSARRRDQEGQARDRHLRHNHNR